MKGRKMKKYSYCIMHDTYPEDDEPCWACIRQFGSEDLSVLNNLVAELPLVPVAKKKGSMWSRFSNKVKNFLGR